MRWRTESEREKVRERERDLKDAARVRKAAVDDWIQEKKHRVAVNAGGTLGCGLMYVGGTCLNEMFLVPAPSLFQASGVHRRSLLHLGRAD